MKKNIFIIFMALSFCNIAFAIKGEGRDFYPTAPLFYGKKESSVKYVPTIVVLEGELQDGKNSNHEKDNCFHDLKFVTDEGKTYSIVNSPQLLKLHHENEKNYRLSIKAEVTPRFLFWGGNLVVDSFSVLNEVSTSPHIVACNCDGD